jgi:hypothetical protein
MAVWARDADGGIPTATANLGGAESSERQAFRNSEIGRAVQDYRDRERGPFG